MPSKDLTYPYPDNTVDGAPVDYPYTNCGDSTTTCWSAPTTKKMKKENITQVDMVNHPKHYTSHPSGIEVIEITRHMNFNLGNAVKYILRCDLKNNATEDLEKAIFYIKDEIEKRKS